MSKKGWDGKFDKDTLMEASAGVMGFKKEAGTPDPFDLRKVKDRFNLTDELIAKIEEVFDHASDKELYKILIDGGLNEKNAMAFMKWTTEFSGEELELGADVKEETPDLTKVGGNEIIVEIVFFTKSLKTEEKLSFLMHKIRIIKSFRILSIEDEDDRYTHYATVLIDFEADKPKNISELDKIFNEVGIELLETNIAEINIKEEAPDLTKAGDGSEGNHRNYNIGRKIDAQTPAFEEELKKLVQKYEAFMDTETFNQ